MSATKVEFFLKQDVKFDNSNSIDPSCRCRCELCWKDAVWEAFANWEDVANTATKNNVVSMSPQVANAPDNMYTFNSVHQCLQDTRRLLQYD